MKKLLSLILALVMVLAMTGCGAASYDKSANVMESPMAAPMEEMGYDSMKGEVFYGTSGPSAVSESVASDRAPTRAAETS